MRKHKLYEPFQLGDQTLKNRIVMSPMQTNYADERGTVTELQVRYYEVRARGGVGTIIVENANVSPGHKISTRHLEISDDCYIPQLHLLADRLRRWCVLPILQLGHAGPKSFVCDQRASLVSASPIPVLGDRVPREMNVEDIQATVADFARAASRGEEAGFGGVELHCAHFYLLSAFLSPKTNNRTDAYGGSTENRLRIVREIIRAVRKATDEGFLVICRINAFEDYEDGLRAEESAVIAQALEAEGIDALHLSAVAPYRMYQGLKSPAAVLLPEVRYIKEFVSVPVIAVGNINQPKVAEDICRYGYADLVALGRALVSDPFFPLKAQTGRYDEIRRCISCINCVKSIQQDKPLTCRVNPNLIELPATEARYLEPALAASHV